MKGRLASFLVWLTAATSSLSLYYDASLKAQNFRNTEMLPDLLAHSHDLVSRLPLQLKAFTSSTFGENLISDNVKEEVLAKGNDRRKYKKKIRKLKPLLLSEEFSRYNPEEVPEESEVSWRDCSAKNVKVYLDSNVKLRCEMWIPLGSTVIWYKEHELARSSRHPNLTFDNPLQYRLPFTTTNEVHDGAQTGRRKYELHLRSVYHLDCVGLDDEGLYTIQILTLSGKVYSRNFRVQSIGTSNRYSVSLCWYFNGYSSFFDPRITEFAKTAVGKQGEPLTLPCRPRELQSIEITWNRTDRIITEESYSITLEGDLQIHKLSLEDRGIFICQVFHYVRDVIYDQISTFVEVID